MDRNELERKIEQELKLRERKVLNRNALNALFGAFTNPVEALGKIFLGRRDALEAEQQRIEQGYVLDLLCAIDTALTEIQAKAGAQGINVSGLIETQVARAEVVAGVHISSGMKNVQIQEGTHVKTVVDHAKSVTGLKIGG